MDVQVGSRTLRGATVTLAVTYRLQRELTQDSEGDDMEVLGRNSREYEVVAKVSVDECLALEKELHRGSTRLVSPLGDHKVVVKRLEFKDDGTLTLSLIEDTA